MRTIWFVLRSKRFEPHQKYLVGFGFEGWSGHAFDSEARIVKSLARRGKLQILQEGDLNLPRC
jgi:hypothetical protein